MQLLGAAGRSPLRKKTEVSDDMARWCTVDVAISSLSQADRCHVVAWCRGQKKSLPIRLFAKIERDFQVRGIV